MARRNHGKRTEDCERKEIFRFYISSNTQGYINFALNPENMKELFARESEESKKKIVEEAKNLLDALKIDFVDAAKEAKIENNK